LETSDSLPNHKFDGVVLGVAHQEFIGLDFESLQKENSVLFDVKGILTRRVDGSL
jgi:UDP-N-acetyl-D-galactosamine dehydrogenase